MELQMNFCLDRYMKWSIKERKSDEIYYLIFYILSLFIGFLSKMELQMNFCLDRYMKWSIKERIEEEEKNDGKMRGRRRGDRVMWEIIDRKERGSGRKRKIEKWKGGSERDEGEREIWKCREKDIDYKKTPWYGEETGRWRKREIERERERERKREKEREREKERRKNREREREEE